MKSKLGILFTVFSAILIIGCGKSDDKSTTEKKTENPGNKTEQKSEINSSGNNTLQVSGNDKTVEIHTSGMTCTACENTIKKKLKKVDGVKDVIADFNSNIVKAAFDPEKTNPEAIKEAITSAGYKVVHQH